MSLMIWEWNGGKLKNKHGAELTISEADDLRRRDKAIANACEGILYDIKARRMK